MSDPISDLLNFLNSDQLNVIEIVVENLLGYSQAQYHHHYLNDKFNSVKKLMSFSQTKIKDLADNSIKILINLCDNLEIRNFISSNSNFLKFLVINIISCHNHNSEIMSILLSNLGKSDNISSILNIKLNEEQIDKNFHKSNNSCDCLLDCFVKGFSKKYNKFTNYDYISYFFGDISRFENVRKYLLTNQSYDNIKPISKIIVFSENYDSDIRREGVAITIKNCMFDISNHYNLITDEDINLLPFILLPISGPEKLEEKEMLNLPSELQFLPNDKKREPINKIICIHLESLLLLSTTRQVRNILRKKSIYCLIRTLHKSSDCDDVMSLCERLVRFLQGDESDDNENLNDILSGIKDDELVEIK